MKKYNLSQIARAANRFHKQGLTLSAAFRAAWKLAKGSGVSRVAGVSLAQRQAVLEEVAFLPSCAVELHRERGNRYDGNAVAVVVSTGHERARLGYLPARVAAYIAPLLDAGETVRAGLAAVCGGYAGLSYGARISLGF